MLGFNPLSFIFNPGSEPHNQCQELIGAIKSFDENKLGTLRENWESIKIHFNECPGCKELGDELQSELKPLLIIWLATPPSPEPIDWSELAEPTFAVEEREKYIIPLNYMWDSWEQDRIFDEIKEAIEEMSNTVALQWSSSASNWFNGFSEIKGKVLEKTEDVQTRIDIAAGYGNFIDDYLVAEDCDITEAKILLSIENETPVLKPERGFPIPVTQIADSISSRSLSKLEFSEELALAISFSLPAHSNVLPTIDVNVVADGCKLTSLWEDPLELS